LVEELERLLPRVLERDLAEGAVEAAATVSPADSHAKAVDAVGAAVEALHQGALIATL
jgi:hypothetical protein